MRNVNRSVVLWWQLVVDVSYKRDAHLGRIVAPQDIADKMRLHLHLHHLKGPSQYSTQNIRIPKFVLRSSVIREFHEVGEGVLFEHEGELLAVASPVRNCRCYVEKYLEPDL